MARSPRPPGAGVAIEWVNRRIAFDALGGGVTTGMMTPAQGRQTDADPDDFDWPPAATSADACEVVDIADEQGTPAVARTPFVPRVAVRRPLKPRPRRAGPDEELVWPPPPDDLDSIETIEIERPYADPLTAVGPLARPHPRGPHIDAVLARRATTPARQVAAPARPSSRPVVPRPQPRPAAPGPDASRLATAGSTSAPTPPLTAGYHPPTLLRAIVIGAALSVAAVSTFWLAGSPTAVGAPRRPHVGVPAPFRPTAVSRSGVDFEWPVPPPGPPQRQPRRGVAPRQVPADPEPPLDEASFEPDVETAGMTVSATAAPPAVLAAPDAPAIVDLSQIPGLRLDSPASPSYP